MSIDKFFFRKYDKNKYNCAHFVCEVWLEETGEDLSEKLTGALLPKKERNIPISARHNFTKLDSPESPCLVIFQSKGVSPHIGIYLRGKVLHIKESGVEYQPIEVVGVNFKKIGFYK